MGRYVTKIEGPTTVINPWHCRHLTAIECYQIEFRSESPHCNFGSFDIIPVDGNADQTRQGFCQVTVWEFTHIFGDKRVNDTVIVSFIVCCFGQARSNTRNNHLLKNIRLCRSGATGDALRGNRRCVLRPAL